MKIFIQLLQHLALISKLWNLKGLLISLSFFSPISHLEIPNQDLFLVVSIIIPCVCLCVYVQHITHTTNSYKLNIWDVGGQKTIRSYWRNYFEQVGCAFRPTRRDIFLFRRLFKSLSHTYIIIFTCIHAYLQTDGLIWVVDSADKRRLEACKTELHALLGQEVI